MKQCLIIADCFENRVRNVTFELVCAARLIQKYAPCSIIVVILGSDPTEAAREFAQQTGLDVLSVTVPEMKACASDTYIGCLSRIIRERTVSHVLIAQNSQGRDFAPGLAATLGFNSISGITRIRFQDGAFGFVRPVMNGHLNSVVSAESGPVILTLQQGSFSRDLPPPVTPGTIKAITIPCEGSGIIHHGIVKPDPGDEHLKAARVVVAAGRGIGSRENLDLVKRLAEKIPGAAVGVSRPLVDMGWIGYSHQVGITGATVTPKLYLALGISGSSQHLAGMKDSAVVVAVNASPDAPIHRHADISIYEDAIEFIRTLLDELG